MVEYSMKKYVCLHYTGDTLVREP